MTFDIQQVKGQLHCDVIMFSKNTFLAIVQHHNSGTEGDVVTIFHIWSDTELVTVNLAAHLEAVEDLQLCPAGLNLCVKHPRFQFFYLLCFLSGSAFITQACKNIQGI